VTALIETIRVRQGRAPLWPLHVARLTASCQALGLPIPDNLAPPGGGQERVHRLEVTESGVNVSQRGPGPTSPIRLITASVTHPGYPHKTTDRGPFDAALVEAHRAGADDGILLTAEGLVAEASIWALFWWEGTHLAAPAMDLRILPSIARARVADLAGGILERRVAPREIGGLPIFVANAVRGVVAVDAWDGQSVPVRLETARLARRFWP
jgi:branched-subunit amino acid aminotransferase/4-amino-4-deoxychorismate lyase